MQIELTGGTLRVNKNGDELAEFYYCASCNDFLALGCEIKEILRGAINSTLLGDSSALGKTHAIQPRFLSASEKLERWGNLWEILKIKETEKINR